MIKSVRRLLPISRLVDLETAVVLDPTRIRPGRHLLVGSGQVRGIALVVDITDGIVHVRPVRGSVTANAHLLDDPNSLAS